MFTGHPWIYRDQLPRSLRAHTGDWVELQAGKRRAFALFDQDSPLALRVYSREQRPDADWVGARVRRAWELRACLRDGGRTNAFRWLNGEGDGLPGIIADHYAGHVVLELDSKACEYILPWAVTALGHATRLEGVVLRTVGKNEPRLSLLSGSLPARDLTVRENDFTLRANLYEGQKTGLFLDQRQNRELCERWASGRRVLNLFSYSGGFSLYAARGGAAHVTSVDISRPAMRDAEENFQSNGFDRARHGFVVADVFEQLEAWRLQRRTFDFVICDPPNFARTKAKLDRALSAYARLFAAALKVTEPGGLFAASSCTARVSASDLSRALAEGASRAHKEVRIIADVGHAVDHPVAAGHPEGRYLKFLLGSVEARG